MRDSLAPSLPKFMFPVLLVANSKNELKYQRKAMEKILEETRGRHFEMLEQEQFRDIITLFLVKGGSVPAKAVFSPTGAFNPILCGFFGTRKTLVKAMEDAEEIKRKYVESGLIADDMADGILRA
jgi:hypothetical protein